MTENSTDNLSPEDYFSLGYLYQYGDAEDDEFVQDYDMARFCYEQAAKKGHAEAQLALGTMYFDGIGVNLDLDEAIKWIRKAAKRGSANAKPLLLSWERVLTNEDNAEHCFMLGKCYAGRVIDSGFENDYELAAFWCRKALEQGYEEAEGLLSLIEPILNDSETVFGLAMSYYFGDDDLEQDHQEAEVWLRQAVRKNHSGAKCALGKMYANGEGLHEDEYDVLSLIRESAKQGYADAQAKLGGMYLTGEYVEQDYAKALFWLQKASEQDHVAAQELLSNLENASDVIDDNEPDFKQILSLAERGDLSAQAKLATAYHQGTNDEIEQDFDKAIFWYKKFLNNPSLTSLDSESDLNSLTQLTISTIYHGEKKEIDEAIYWAKKAAEQDFSPAQVYLGSIYQELDDDEEAFFWLQKAAENNEPLAQSQLGKFYLLGTEEVEADEAKALFWFLKAAEQGDVDSQNNLAYMYLNGVGAEIEEEKAAFWIKEAAEQGQVDAQRNLGAMYSNGVGVKQSFSKAVFWYQKAVEQDDMKAKAYLAICYENGDGVIQDHKKAFSLFKEAAEEGYADAQAKLGDMYLKGQGVTKNKEQAIFWLRKAAAQGQEDAQKILSEMQLGNSTEAITVSINISSSLLKRDAATQSFEDMF